MKRARGREAMERKKGKNTCLCLLQPHFKSQTFKYLHALVTAKLLAVSILSTCGTRLKGASVALGLVLWRKIASRNAVYSWSVFLMNNPPRQSDKRGRAKDHDGGERKWVIVGRRGVGWERGERGRETGRRGVMQEGEMDRKGGERKQRRGEREESQDLN